MVAILTRNRTLLRMLSLELTRAACRECESERAALWLLDLDAPPVPCPKPAKNTTVVGFSEKIASIWRANFTASACWRAITSVTRAIPGTSSWETSCSMRRMVAAVSVMIRWLVSCRTEMASLRPRCVSSILRISSAETWTKWRMRVTRPFSGTVPLSPTIEPI